MVDLAEFGAYEFEGLPRSDANLNWLRQNFECQQCGECCHRHTEGVRITYAEAERLARRDKCSLKAFLDTVQSFPEDCVIAQPCRYLENNRCSVHDIKPGICCNYPFHHCTVQGVATPWVIITACPGGKKLIEKILSGRQQGLEYRPG